MPAKDRFTTTNRSTALGGPKAQHTRGSIASTNSCEYLTMLPGRTNALDPPPQGDKVLIRSRGPTIICIISAIAT